MTDEVKELKTLELLKKIERIGDNNYGTGSLGTVQRNRELAAGNESTV
jgi:hypothetical protein